MRHIKPSYWFHDDDWPSKKDYALLRFSLISKHFSKDESKLFFGYINSIQLEYLNYEDRKLEPHEFFGNLDAFPLAKYVVFMILMPMEAMKTSIMLSSQNGVQV